MNRTPDQDSSDYTFLVAEQTGLKLAIKGRLVALVLVGGAMTLSRGVDRAPDFIAATLLFMALGALHFRLIGSSWDRWWVKYVFLSVDILLLSAAVAVMPPTPEAPLPQVMTFRFSIFPFYFIILGIATFSFSPGLVLWAGALGAAGWLGAFAWVVSAMEKTLDWSDIGHGMTKEDFLAVVLNENFVATGSRVQEAMIFFVVAALIAIVMRRARQTVRRQLEAEKDKASVSQMFGQFVPKAVADIMIKDQGTLAPVERHATVLFTDLAGFTSLTEERGPKAIVDILNAWFDEATEIIGKHNGVVTQFQGDAILAIFNVPLENEDHAQHAYNAAVELLETIQNKAFAGQSLAGRVGLNTGPLIAGNVGGGGRQTYTVHGDTVNLAARLEALNKDFDTSLLVSAATVALLSDHDLEKIGETSVRGLSDPVDLFTLRRSST